MNYRRARMLLATLIPVFALTGWASGEPAPQDPRPAKSTVMLSPLGAQPKTLGLPDLIRLALERNPRLAQAGSAVEAARGRAVQAGLYPNPTVTVLGDELGDRTGPAGIERAPSVSQEIVTANKLGLSRAAACREVDQATLALLAERCSMLVGVRQSYFETLTLQRRAEILGEQVRLAEQSVEATRRLVEAKQAARLDLVQLEIERDRIRADKEATERALPAAFRRLASQVGVPELPGTAVVGALDAPTPDYDLERARQFMLEAHPEIRSARLGVERANLLLQRAQAESVPNVTVEAAYVRQNENKSNDWSVGVSVPVPLWNRNQGNILAAQAQVGQAVAQVGRVENDLVNRLATAYGTYAAARERADRYRTAILPSANEGYQLTLQAYQGGQFDFLRVLQAQRTVAEANLEYIKAMGEAWRAASEIAGLMLEEDWPCAPTPDPQAPPPR